jgi:hypothetical protein
MPTSETPKVINLYGSYTQHEAIAGGTIVPGMLVELEADAVDTVEAHGDAGGVANPCFAREYYEVGKGIDDAYVNGNQVIYYTFQPGAGVYALLAANAAAITKGAFLSSAGDGTLKLAADGDIVIAQAREAVNNSAGATRARIRVEILAPQALNPATA